MPKPLFQSFPDLNPCSSPVQTYESIVADWTDQLNPFSRKNRQVSQTGEESDFGIRLPPIHLPRLAGYSQGATLRPCREKGQEKTYVHHDPNGSVTYEHTYKYERSTTSFM